MNIHQGLKEKNRLAGLLKQLDERIKNNTRWVKGNKPSYDLKELLEERSKTVSELNTLKVRISLATGPIVSKILQLAETKSYIAVLKGLDLSAGVDDDRHGRRYSLSATTLEYEAAMTEKERDKQVDQLQIELGKVQDELDSFNATTEI
jgi:hypothetical protein